MLRNQNRILRTLLMEKASENPTDRHSLHAREHLYVYNTCITCRHNISKRASLTI